MTTIDKIKAEIQKVLDAEPDTESAKAQVLALFWVLELLDKYAEQEPSDDAISRQAVLDRIKESIETYHNQYTTDMLNMWGLFTQFIKEMPPVNPQPKTGHWIDIMVGDMPAQACDQCNTFYPLAYTGGGHNYCPNCGAKMVEPQESEDKK